MSTKKMPKKLQKSLQEYLSKIKSPTPSKNWILPGCKYPKTPSFAFRRTQIHENERNNNNNNIRNEAATLSDVDRFLLENFKSLYIKNDEDDDYPRRQNKSIEEELEVEQHGYDSGDRSDGDDDGGCGCGGVLYDSSPKSTFELPPDLIGSHRFFFAAGSSSSLIEEARSSLATTSSEEGRSSSSTISNNTLNHDHMSIRSSNSTNDDSKNDTDNNVELPKDCIAVIRYSNSPNDDFKRSMQEMAESRIKRGENIDWDFLQELLYCYLDLNEKKSHKFILSAFVDLIVGLRQRSDKVPARARGIARERRKLGSIT